MVIRRSRKQTKTTVTAIAYLRVSTEDQQLGPEAQRSAIEAWAAREGVRIASWHVDQGVSGAAPLTERPALLEAITAVRDTKASLLVVAKRDRLARDPFIAGVVEQALDEHKARVFSADGVGNGTSGADAFVRRILDAQAEFERAQIRQRTRDALAEKKRRGELTGKAPYGLRVSVDGVRLEPNADEVAIIARAKALSDTGLTVRAIAAALNAEGYRNRAGRPFAFQSVHAFLRPLLEPAA